MKKFEFHLEKLLSYKDQRLNSEMMTLGVLQNELAQAKEVLSQLENQLTQYKRKLQEEMSEKVNPATCQVCVNYIAYLKEQIKQCRKEVDLITEKVNRQIDIVKGLKLDSRSLETMKDSRFEEYKKEEQKKSEAQLEEFFSTLKVMSIVV